VRGERIVSLGMGCLMKKLQYEVMAVVVIFLCICCNHAAAQSIDETLNSLTVLLIRSTGATATLKGTPFYGRAYLTVRDHCNVTVLERMNWTYADGSKDTGGDEYLFSLEDVDPSTITINGDDNSGAFEIDFKTLDSANAITERDPRDRSTESKTSLMGIAYFVSNQDAEKAVALFRHATELCVQERPSPEAIAEQQRQKAFAAAEQQRQKAIRDANELAAERGRIDQSVQQLAQLLEGNFKIYFDYPNIQNDTVTHHIKRHVTLVSHCELSYTEEDNQHKKQGPMNVHLVFANVTADSWNNENVNVYPGAAVLITPGGPLIPISTDPYTAIKLVNELHRACSP